MQTAEIELALKASSGPISDRELQKLLWFRDDARLLRKTSVARLMETPTTGARIRQLGV